MLTQDSSSETNNSNTAAPSSKEQAMIESLRAAYWNAFGTTGRPTPHRRNCEAFSTFIGALESTPKHQKIANTPQIKPTPSGRPARKASSLTELGYLDTPTIYSLISSKPVEFDFPLFDEPDGQQLRQAIPAPTHQPKREADAPGDRQAEPMQLSVDEATREPATECPITDNTPQAATPEPDTLLPSHLQLEQQLERQNEEELNYLLQHELSLDLPPYRESWLVKLFSRPKLALSIMGMCLLASSVYAGLGYWWLVSGTGVSNAAEPVNLMQVQENTPKPVNHPGLNHINTLQSQPPIVVPKEETEPQEQTLLALATAAPKVATAPESQSPPREREPELTGRADPFAPLVQANTPIQSDKDVPPPKKDILEDMQYTGFVGNINAKNKLAIIKVIDSASGSTQTLIKKIGATFYVDGEKVVLKGISKNSVQLYAAGESRKLNLSPYQAVTSAPSAPTGAGGTGASATAPTATGGAASNPTGRPAGGGESSGALGNLGALSGRANNPANPQLAEP